MVKRRDQDCSAAAGRRLRQAVGLIGSQELAASIAGVSVSTLQRYMRGETPITLRAAYVICAEVRVSLVWLATGEGELGSAPCSPPDAPAGPAEPSGEACQSLDDLAGPIDEVVSGLSATLQAFAKLRARLAGERHA